ncbi:hypothetical protein B0H16DRAFT_1712953 [Mycena metata]|uniref:Uncharacterized protein n=1 Tax=Mycena metata TaxID=1033252 RepID=A0AAD7K451_9AGAR|nr:hypothetical protein B0H16DRAFT_1712953 [Mycena metata]
MREGDLKDRYRFGNFFEIRRHTVCAGTAVQGAHLRILCSFITGSSPYGGHEPNPMSRTCDPSQAALYPLFVLGSIFIYTLPGRRRSTDMRTAISSAIDDYPSA